MRALQGEALARALHGVWSVLNSVKGQTRAKKENWIALRINNDAPDEPAEILIYEPIGRDPWGDGGLTAKDFQAILDQVPKTRDLHVRINCKGGDVHEGMTIKNKLDEWPKKVVCTIDGVAASTASWIPMGCDEVRASKNSQIFVHDAIAFGYGNAEDLRKAADNLDKTSDQIAGMYSEKAGKSKKSMRELMRNETLMTGEEAEELGLVDTLTNEPATYNFTNDELQKMKEKLKTFLNSAAKSAAQNNNIMNKKEILALLREDEELLKQNNITVTDEMTDEQLQAALKQLIKSKKASAENVRNKKKVEEEENEEDPDDQKTGAKDLASIRNEIKELKKANEALLNANTEAKRIRITNTVEALIANDQIPAGLKEKAITRAMADETYLNELRDLPARPPGAAPLSASRVECTGDSFKDVQNFMLDNGPRFTGQFIRNGADKAIDQRTCLEIRDRAVVVANTWKKHRQMLTDMFNTNTIDAALQRVVILQEMLEEFAVVLLPLQNFSVVFNNVPLEGTDEVAVPFYPLAAGASQSFDPATGYNTFANTATNMRKVAVGGGTPASSGANAAANTAKDRKYIGMAFSSYELARQPYLNVQKLGVQNANKLAVDIFSDIISRVITAGNFGASIKPVAAAAFSGDDIADLYGNATGRNWPARGRALVLDHTYNVSLIKDPTYKQYLAYGSTDPIRKALIQQAYGFESIPIVPNLTTYSPAGEFLVGWLNWLYAVLVATSPIMPTPEVRNLLTRYDVVVHPTIGIALEYRRMGDTTLDQTKEVVECSYGAAKGVETALARLTSQ